MDITKFGLSNFRVFKEHFDFDLAPIMVLTGPNNSGKSSLSKALLLLKENEDIINYRYHLNSNKLNYFKGEHDLGNHNYTINTKGENTRFSFTFFLKYKFQIEITNTGEFTWDYSITTKDDKLIICQLGSIIKIDVKNIIQYLKDRLALALEDGNLEYLEPNPYDHLISKDYFQNPEFEVHRIEELIHQLEDFGKEINYISFNCFWENRNHDPMLFVDDSCITNGIYTNRLQIEAEENLQNGIFNPYFSDYNTDLYLSEYELEDQLINLFNKITSIKLTDKEIQFLFPPTNNGFFMIPNIRYVKTIKEPLKRAYSRNDSSVFQLLINEQISNGFSEGTNTKTNFKYQSNASLEKSETYEQFTRKWLKEFEIGKELSYGYDEENDIYFVKVDNKSLPEYGLGFGLIIHILLALSNENNTSQSPRSNFLKIPFPSTYIIEEPETGLHPAFQSKMAEMIVDIQKTFNVNLIIETHSEYLIRKLQYLTATHKINPGETVIYYFNNPKNVPDKEEQIKKITIAKDGSLSDSFGTGFIDEGINLKFDLLRLAKNQQN